MLPLVISAAELQPHLHDTNLLLLDLSSIEHYRAGHIPGAIHMDASRLLRGEGPVPNLIPTEAQLSQLFSELGLYRDTQVVAYDDQKGPWAGRLIWTLHCIGHTRASVLDGQLPAWQAAGLPLEQTAQQATASVYQAQRGPELCLNAEQIVDKLEAEDFRIWDARSAQEYTGEKVVNAQRGGHIPGAIHLEWTDLLQDGDIPLLKPRDEILALLQAKGLTPEQQIVTHCQTHRRSGLTYLAGKWAGLEHLACYDGSWFEWGNRADLPVTTA